MKPTPAPFPPRSRVFRRAVCAAALFACATLPPLPEPDAWRITDGEGSYNYSDDEPELFNVDWAARYGRKYETLFTAAHLHAYALAARRAALEEAARAFEAEAASWNEMRKASFLGAIERKGAAAIRALAIHIPPTCTDFCEK